MSGIYALWLVDAARSTGYPVTEVTGWATRGHDGMRVIEGVVGHHTGTADSAPGDYPSLRVVRDGRAGLAGPLCNFGLGRSGRIYVVAAGAASHAGKSAHAGFTGLNDEFLGIEAEHAGGAAPWPTAQLDAYVRLVAACLRYIRRSPARYVSHRECALPAGRKPDPRSIADDWMRARVEAVHRGDTALTAPAATPPPGASSLPTLEYGMRGHAAVARLQRWVVPRYGYCDFPATGNYLDKTADCLAEFQRRMGVRNGDGSVPDGRRVGDRTKMALWAEGYRG